MLNKIVYLINVALKDDHGVTYNTLNALFDVLKSYDKDETIYRNILSQLKQANGRYYLDDDANIVRSAEKEDISNIGRREGNGEGREWDRY